jgi:hypothetical protein
MKSKSEEKHDALVRKLEAELSEVGAFCQTFIPYSEGKITGEIDLFAICDTLPPQYEFYEIKCHNSRRKVIKAKEQYHRFLRAYNLNERLVWGFLVTGEGRSRIL